MAVADRVKDTTSTAGSGTVTLAQSVQAGFQLFGTAFPAATTVTYCISSRTTADWEVGNGLFTPPASLTRSPTSSSNANALVTFGAEIKDVFVTQSASNIAKQPVTDDITFAATVPLTGLGTRYMPQQAVAAVIAFAPAASPVKGSYVYVRVIADGTNVPTFTGFKEWGGSLGYDNRNGIANQITFFFDGADSWYSVSQAVGAVAIASGITLAGPTSGAVSTASTNFTVGVTPVGGTITGTVVVTPSDAAGGGTFTPATVSLTTATPTGAFTYTPNATVATRTISVTNNGGLASPAVISYNVTAVAVATIRFANLVSTTESGTGPYTYTGTGGAFGAAGIGGVGTTGLQTGVDGSAIIKVTAYTATTNEVMFALGSQTTTTAFANFPVMVYSQGSTGRYEAFINGTDQGVPTNTVAPAVNDLMKLTRTGTTVVAAVSKDSGSTYTTIFTFTGVAATATRFHTQLSGVASCQGGATSGLA